MSVFETFESNGYKIQNIFLISFNKTYMYYINL